MATTRQRGRSGKAKTPVTALQPPINEQNDVAGNTPSVAPVPDRTFVANAPADTSKVRFVGEQIAYRSREERIAAMAYAFAQARDFEPGHEVEDWLRAEKEVDALLSGSGFTY